MKNPAHLTEVGLNQFINLQYLKDSGRKTLLLMKTRMIPTIVLLNSEYSGYAMLCRVTDLCSSILKL